MSQTTITSKGQVTIPKQVRKALKLETGDKIEVIVTDNNEAIIRPIKRRTDEVYKKLHKYGKRTVSVEEMNQVIRKKMEKTFK